MGFSKKEEPDLGLDAEGRKWGIAGIPIRKSLKPINTKPRESITEENDEESCSTTPKAEDARIPKRLTCPPAPMKPRPPSRCHFHGVKEFFNPPDLDTVFVRHVEKAS